MSVRARAAKRTATSILLLGILLLATLAAGCGFLSRSKPRIYSLERIAPAAAAAGAARGLPVGIDVLELPPPFFVRV